jgi:hypothetical protein
MKQLISQKIMYVLLVAFLITACKTEKKSSDNNEKAKDTITTASGLKYYYLTKGTGRKVEPGSKISAQLSLKVKDSVVWTSYQSKDSIFSHIAGRGGVIKGYDEMALLMREGDNVVAILPSNIAYGARGSGEAIPPNATLIYDRFKITYVSEPKLVLSDTLFYALKNDGIQSMKAKYQVATTKDSANYHGGMDQLDALWRKLRRASMFAEAEQAYTFLNTKSSATNFEFYIIRSLENQGKLKEAITKIDKVLKTKLSPAQKEYFIKYKQDLMNKSKK